MKTIFTITFLFFTLIGFSQTTREEVVKRTEGGLKLEVITYSGSGNSEKIIKKCFYQERPDYYRPDGVNNVSTKPHQIAYYGNYKVEWTSPEGKTRTALCYGIIKSENFDLEGKIESTTKITDNNGEVNCEEALKLANNFSSMMVVMSALKGTVKYTILP